MGALSPTHWLIVVGVLLLLFGAKRLPETARGIGRSARILKAEMREVTESVRLDAPAPLAAGEAAVGSSTSGESVRPPTHDHLA
jgi:sec-independent protein translocase protein TatA